MPKRLNSDAEAYDKEYNAFIKQLEDFHQQRGTPFKRLPKINGKPIDLYLLYVVVTAKGGWQKVNSRNEWYDLLEDFWLSSSCVNSCTALKHIYIRYLDVYERIHFLGEDGTEKDNDGDDDESRSTRIRRSVRSLNNVPLTYNTQQHNVTDLQRLNGSMSTTLYQQSQYDRLALSLECPLPNEHDFAFNMCTLLSNEGKLTLKLSECPKLIELMVAHTGVFREDSTQKYFISNYKDAKGKNLLQFWGDSVNEKSVLKLLHCSKPKIKKPDDPSKAPDKTVQSTDTDPPKDPETNTDQQPADTRNQDQRGDVEICESGGSSETKKESSETDLGLEPANSDLFHLGRDLGLLDSEGTRISQVLHILRNLSFEENNVTLLANSDTCLRFLVLCICSRWGGLSVGALDTLGNIATEIALPEPKTDATSQHLLSAVCKGVSSQDRAFVLRCLEVLNKLAANDNNEEILNGFIEQQVYDQICQYLTIHDIMLLIYTLECLFSLSSLGSHACNAIVRAKGCVSTLVSLLTVEAQSYGPDACIGMRVVETTVIGSYKADQAESQSNPAPNTTTTMAAPTSVATPQVVTSPANIPKTMVGGTTLTTPKPVPRIAMDPKRIAAKVVPQEVEDFAVDWVKKNYVVSNDKDIGVEQALVIRHFTAAMCANGKRQGLNPVFLSTIVRKVFGLGVGPTRRRVEDGTEKWHYTGIRRRDDHSFKSVVNNNIGPSPIITSTKTEATPVVEGSILKAHLSAPLRNSPVRGTPPPGYIRSTTQSNLPFGSDPTLRPSLNTSQPSDNSTLIKSLLANKVTNTPERILVSPPQSQRSVVTTPTHSGPLPSMPFTKMAQTVLNNANQNPQITRHIQNGPVTSVSSDSKMTNGIPAEVKKIEQGSLPTSFEGILQNGVKEDVKPGEPERKNLLADLLEKTVGDEVLNGVVGKEIVSSRVMTKSNGNQTLNGPVESGIKRSASPDTNPSKRMAVDGSGQGPDSKITLYVSQNGNEGEILSQGHQVIYNQGQAPAGQSQNVGASTPQVLNTQTVVTPTGQVIIQRALPQSNVIVQRAPSPMVQRTTGTTQVVQSTANSVGQVLPSAVTQMINSNGQIIQQVIAQNQNGQKVILHGSQLGQVLGNQVILPSNSQGLVVQGSSGPVLVQSVPTSTNPVYVQGTNGQGQQVLVQANQVSSSQSNQVVVSCASSGQTMILATNQGQQQVVVGNPPQTQQMVVQSNPSNNTVFLTPQQTSSGQKTLIILPNQKIGLPNQNSNNVVVSRQAVQVTSSTPSTPVTHTTQPPVQRPRPTPVVTVSQPVAPLPKGPVATPVIPSSASLIPTQTTPTPAPIKKLSKTGLQYVCEWRGCNEIFSSPGLVYHHACRVHCPSHMAEITCQWQGCEPMVRRRFSAMTHIQDRHCNEQLLQVHAVRRQQIQTSGKTDIPIPQTAPPHPGYAPNAAFHAIKRHALEVITQRDAVETEGPVTKSIRLTAALVLRNLVIYSNMGKKLLHGHEAELANVAISSMESSRTVGQMLYDIHAIEPPTIE